MLTNGQIKSTREGSPALDTVADFEMAQRAASAGLAQFEGMHRLAPDNEDALFLLTKGWTGYGFAFVEDEYEIAYDKHDNALAEYHKKRAKNAYERGIFYGLELLGKKAEGFEQAKKMENTLKAWLKEHFDSPEDAPNLFWTGYAWLARANIMKEDAEHGGAYIAEAFVGVAMIERVNELDPSYNNYAGTVAMAAWNARSPTAGNMKLAQQLFEDALAKTQRKALVVQLNYATRYACGMADGALYEKLLNEVLQAEDPDPNNRLQNTIAKRRAARAMSAEKMQEICGIKKSAPPPKEDVKIPSD
jgi:hypothetical protein